MAYREIVNVTTGVKAQLEACLNALDLHQELPDEAEDLGATIAKAYKLCDAILVKARKEPVPDEPTPHLNPDGVQVQQ